MSIYFISAPSGYIKIGFTSGPIQQRLEMLQVGCWETLTVDLVIDGGKKQERHYHRQFRASHIRGDWFRLSVEIREYIDHYAERRAQFDKHIIRLAV